THQLPPAVALRNVNDLISLFQPGHRVDADVFRVRGPNERLALLVDEISRLAAQSVHFDKTETLMSAVHFLISEGMAAALPAKPRCPEVDFFDVAFSFPRRGHVEMVQFIAGEFVAWQRIRARVKFGPTAAGRRRLE